MRWCVAGVVLASILGASAAGAVTITTSLELRSGAPIEPRELVGVNSAGLRAVFSGWTRDGDLTRQTLSRTNQGLGIADGGSLTEVDGGSGMEFVRVRFSQVVDLIDVTFGKVSTGESFRISSGDETEAYGNFSSNLQIGCNNCSTSGIGSYSFLTALTGSAFAFMAPGADDSWTLRGMTISHKQQPAPVPLPAAGLLLIGGMAGLGLVARRQRARSA